MLSSQWECTKLLQLGTSLRGELNKSVGFLLTSVLVRFPDCEALVEQSNTGDKH